MKKSSFVTNISCNDPNYPGSVINLSVHHVDGGYIGIDCGFVEQVANYVVNPYCATQFIKLDNSDLDDEVYDPPTDGDSYYAALRLLTVFDDVLVRSTAYNRASIMNDLERYSGIPSDQIEVILGTVRQALHEMRSDDA
jgi:hypothetical protein